jgi:hypothetical protein
MSDDDIRTRADERRRLLAQLELERNQFIRNVETCRIRDIERPFIGEWSVKDIVGHIASWEAEVVTTLRDLRAGRRPELYDFNRSRLDAWNKEHVERKRSIDFFSVLDQLRAGRQRLLEELAHFSDEDLVDEGSRVQKLVRALIDHDREHWHAIAARLAGMDGARRTGAQSIVEEATS